MIWASASTRAHTMPLALPLSLPLSRCRLQIKSLASQSVGDAELLLCLLWCLREGWPASSKDHVPVEMREMILQVHAR